MPAESTRAAEAVRTVPAAARSTARGMTVFLLGLALTGALYALVHVLAGNSLLFRYVAGHPIEYVETWLFVWAMLALMARAAQLRYEQRGVTADMLPPWSGEPTPVEAAGGLLDRLARTPRRWHASLAYRRLYAGLAFAENRGSTDGLDEHLRGAAEADADAADSAGALVRYLTWAIPILGFLGTVVGITEAIANISPEQLTNSITGVTDGLAVAFDTTAIALGYSIAIMFFSFVLDRKEQRVLNDVTDLADAQLAHRFVRRGQNEHQVVAALQHVGDVLVQTTQEVVERQVEIWTKSMEALRQRLDNSERQQHERLQAGLSELLRTTVETHQRQLLAFQQQLVKETSVLLPHFEKLGHALRESSAALERHSQRTAEQAALFGQLLEGEQHVLRLQESMNQTLLAITQTGALDRTLHSLTAAVHLLTSRAEGPTTPAGVVSAASRAGKAA
jgi:hypothetical protein